MPKPWNDWYHITAHVYGSWLRGDPRGWRTFRHREHVEGDYRNPPKPGDWEWVQQYSRFRMKRDPIGIARDLRKFIVTAVADRLISDGVEVLIVSMDAKHLHLLGRFRGLAPGVLVGRAKKHASHLLRQEGLRMDEGGIWGRRSRAEPVRDRAHQVNVFRYILRHSKQGAAIWRFDRDKATPQ